MAQQMLHQHQPLISWQTLNFLRRAPAPTYTGPTSEDIDDDTTTPSEPAAKLTNNLKFQLLCTAPSVFGLYRAYYHDILLDIEALCSATHWTLNSLQSILLPVMFSVGDNILFLVQQIPVVTMLTVIQHGLSEVLLPLVLVTLSSHTVQGLAAVAIASTYLHRQQRLADVVSKLLLYIALTASMCLLTYLLFLHMRDLLLDIPSMLLGQLRNSISSFLFSPVVYAGTSPMSWPTIAPPPLPPSPAIWTPITQLYVRIQETIMWSPANWEQWNVLM